MKETAEDKSHTTERKENAKRTQRERKENAKIGAREKPYKV